MAVPNSTQARFVGIITSIIITLAFLDHHAPVDVDSHIYASAVL
jgi:hypothetical protein